MICHFSLCSPSAAVAAAVLMAAAPINANHFGLREGRANQLLSAENNLYIPRKLANSNNDPNVDDEGIKRSLSIENTLWPATRGYQPTIKNSLRAQTDNGMAIAGGHNSHLMVDLGILDEGFSATNDAVPAMTDGDSELDDVKSYYGAIPSDTSTLYRTDSLLGTSTNSARNLSDSHCYEKCGLPSQRPIASNLRSALSACAGDNTSSNCPYTNVDIECWNVSELQYLGSSIFPRDFNEPLECWDVSNVTDMNRLFEYAQDFNQSINRWNVSSVTDMRYMFNKAGSFNLPLDNWDVSSVTSMDYMFYQSFYFNQPLDEWDVSSLEYARSMFFIAGRFNQCISTWSYKTAFVNTYLMFSYTSCPNYNFNCLEEIVEEYGEEDAYFYYDYCFPDANQGPWCQGPSQECFPRPPTESPSSSPTESFSPSDSPTENPSESPSKSPSESPSKNPTVSPSDSPTENPSESPTKSPSDSPSENPTVSPSDSPTENPTESPSKNPTVIPSDSPTEDPCTNKSESLSCDAFAALPQDVLGSLCDLADEFATSCPGLCSSICVTPSPTESPTSSPTPTCKDKSKEFEIDIDGTLKTKDCEWVASKKKAKRKEYCGMKVDVNGNMKKLPAICKKTCGELGRGECGFLNDV